MEDDGKEGFASLDEWLASRPAIVRELLTEFPLGTEIEGSVDGPHWVIGATEDPHGVLVVTPIDPRVDFEAAKAAKLHLCAHHLRNEACEIAPSDLNPRSKRVH